nr:hypothetical protein [Tanacetum cinerariifolium]
MVVPQPSNPIENVVPEAIHEELGDSLVRAANTGSSLEAEQDSGNINKTQSKVTPNESSSQGTNLGGGLGCQETMRDTTAQTRLESVFKHSNDSLLARESANNKESLGEDASKQERINAIDADKEITLVNVQDNADKEMFDVNILDALEEIKRTKPKEKGVDIQELGKSTLIKSSQQSHDTCKGILIEPVIEPVKPMKRKNQIMFNEEAALKLQAAFDKEERCARKKVKKLEEANIPLIETWDDIQVKIDADH